MSDDFFEAPPPSPPRPPRFRQPPWLAPPQWTLPGVVPFELVLVKTDELAIGVTRLAAYPNGFGFELFAFADPHAEESEAFERLIFGPRGPHSTQSTDALRIGVQFADGAKATNTAGFHHRPEQPSGPVLSFGGGGGGGGRWRTDVWVWPLPPPGPLAFVCQWPAANVSLTRHEIDAQTILDAVSHAKVIFSDEGLPDPPR